MAIYFVSLISRENQPLYIQSFTAESNELLKYNFLSHMSVDIFESPFMPMAEMDPPQGKTYQLLFAQEGVFVYGQELNTGLKIVVGSSKKEPGLNEVFKQIHKAYLRMICNPFVGSDKVDREIDDPKFDERIKEIVGAFNERA